jgi:hypothetical protein
MVGALREVGNVTRTKAGRRKLRLFACGCCRLVWGQLCDPRLRAAVELAERFADGQATKEELAAASVQVRGSALTQGGYQSPDRAVQEMTAAAMAMATTHAKPMEAAFCTTVFEEVLPGYPGGKSERWAVLCNLLRCVFGNPFRPLPLSTACHAATVVALAHAAYAERSLPSGELDPTRLAVLADALEDAGCSEEALLLHLRGPGPHVRGCWVVDLLTGKS